MCPFHNPPTASSQCARWRMVADVNDRESEEHRNVLKHLKWWALPGSEFTNKPDHVNKCHIRLSDTPDDDVIEEPVLPEPWDWEAGEPAAAVAEAAPAAVIGDAERAVELAVLPGPPKKRIRTTTPDSAHE